MGVVKTAAPIAANLVLPGSGTLVNGLMDAAIAEVDPGVAVDEMSQKEKAALVAQNPEMLAKLEEVAKAYETEVAKQRTANMAQVNDTMKAELKDGRWYQRAWRPWNGFLFPLTVIGVYVAWPIIRAFLMANHPQLAIAADIEVPTMLWVTWGGVLGVAVYGRNKEKMAGKEQGPPGLIAGLLSKLAK